MCFSVKTAWRTKDTCKCSMGEFLECWEANLDISIMVWSARRVYRYT